MTKIKKVFLIILILAFGLAVVVFVRTRNVLRKEGPPPEPSIPTSYKGSVQFSFNVEGVSLPPNLPFLNVYPAKEISLSKAKEYAGNLGYNFEPRTATDVYDGLTYIWEDNNSSLYVRTRTSKIEYQAFVDPFSVNNKQLSNDSIKRIAQDFLNKIVSDQVDTSGFSNIFFYNGQPAKQSLTPSKKDVANFYQVNFSPSFSGHEILTLDPSKTPITVTVLPDGTVYKVEVNLLGNIEESQSQFPTKNLQDVKNSSKNAVLVSLDDGNVFLSDLSAKEVENTEITDISVAYFRDKPTDTTYQPIYILKGTSQLADIEKQVDVVLYLPAIKY